MALGDRLRHAWNAFTGAPDQFRSYGGGESYSYGGRPYHPRMLISNERSIISSIYTRLGVDVASVDMRHVRVDDQSRYLEDVDSGLNSCLTLEANLDQAARAFRQDAAMSLFDFGVIAIVPVDTTISPLDTGGWDIRTLRVGEIIAWYPEHVRINLYNDKVGTRQQVTLPKSMVAIVENPLYSVMNEPNSTLQRLMRKLSLLDTSDELVASGKLDLIIQLPYVIKSETRRQQAEQRRKDIEFQLKGSQYGIAYTDGTEKITQLNRPAENNLLAQVEMLTKLLYVQLGLTEEVMNGTADEKTMLNYRHRTVEPVCDAIVEAMRRTFLTKTARTQGQTVLYFMDPFKLIPIGGEGGIADIADKFARNEILSSNEIRQIVGYKPSKEKKADQLVNSNMPRSDTGVPDPNQTGPAPDAPNSQQLRKGTVKMGEISHLDVGDKSPETSLMHSATTAVKPDFSGWATKYNLECSDGRTIVPDAFEDQDKLQVPLVWQHGHSDPGNVLGHAILEHRAGEGVYTYGYFNSTPSATNAKTLIEHDDIRSLSIFANKLIEKAKKVSHGVIRECSLVLAGANPGALIDNIELQHADGDLVTIEDEAIIYTGETLKHGDESAQDDPPSDKEPKVDEPTVQDVYDTMTDEQKEAVHYMVGAALESNAAASGADDITHSSSKGGDDKEGRSMSRNVFENQNPGTGSGEPKHELTHDAIRGIAQDAAKRGSLKEAVEAYALQHGINDIDILFPDARTLTTTPDFDSRRVEWVRSVINGTRHSPFSRIKSLVADITADEARALGYIKGNLKKEEFFGLAKRVTTPTTVYKKQKLDRDDIIDITDFDVVQWLKGEMRLMLDEEIARAILIGDGRAIDNEDKIRDPAASADGAGIRSVLNDHDLYAPKIDIPGGIGLLDSAPSDVVDAILLQMGQYKGSGQPTFYTTLSVLTKLLLARDQTGRRFFRTASDLASELGVSTIVAVEAMEGQTDLGDDGTLIGIIVNLTDYVVGADRGGDVSMFDDFDIDYNQYKYLIETRCSGALTKIRSALVLRGTDALGG